MSDSCLRSMAVCDAGLFGYCQKRRLAWCNGDRYLDIGFAMFCGEDELETKLVTVRDKLLKQGGSCANL